ncbi:MAG TPA: L-2-amino-thiazoline-4-carboxylic acid hydrolase [Dehalococcoidia bacterium]|nr:L-2-amino-thiazoline-4-carboxylic acid hydrolase [Dehalococcoidia bacterium]
MNHSADEKHYYLAQKPEIMLQFDTHAKAWRPFLAERYGDKFADTALEDTRQQYEALIPTIPYIGGDENPMTRHLVRSTTSLVLYKVMKARGKTAEEVGKIVYDAVETSVNQMPPLPSPEFNTEFTVEEKEQARKSQERRYSGDWVWEFVKGDGVEFDYGRDFLECSTKKLYYAHGADEFLPFYCYLDFVTHRTIGWGFTRTKTLAEGDERCDFRWKKGGETKKGWPPPFLKRK